MNVKSNNEIKSMLALTGLYNVLDPEIGMTIVDLGLVYQIDFKEENKEILVTMTLTTQFCPMGDSIVEATTQSMQQSFPDYKIQINLIFDPAWDVSMISEEGNAFLNR